MIDLLIISPSDSMTYNVPAGYIFADEVFAEAKLQDPISKSQKLTYNLERALIYLAKKYPGRLRLRWLNLWSLGGVWVTFRYKLRSFPTVIDNNKHVLSDEQLQFDSICNFIDSLLSQPKN